jgi:serine protease Do
LVAGVLPGSRAEQNGLRAGDLLLEVNKRPVADLRAYEDALKESKDSALIRYKRGDSVKWIAVPIP